MKSHMLTEILEQPQVIFKIIEEYVKDDNINIEIPENIKKIKFIASGSSYNSAKIAVDLFNNNTDIDVDCEYSSEFLCRKKFTDTQNDFYIFLSQSGETTDTINALKKIKNAHTMAITNNINSTLWNNSDYKINLYAGEEKSIASTKAVTAQILFLYLLMLKFVSIKNCTFVKSEILELKSLPEDIQKFLQKKEHVKPIAKKISNLKNIIILGTNYNYSLALEGALKIKETAYINVNAYPSGEFLHGHMAILNSNNVGIISLFNSQVYLNKLQKNYSPSIINISSESSQNNINIFQSENPSEIFKILHTLIFFQILAYETAIFLGKNIDNPIGLSKIVLDDE